MNAAERDPIVDSLDRLADLADTGLRGDRMPDIQRRVRVARRRRRAVIGVAAVVLVSAGMGIWATAPRTRTAPPTPPHDEFAQQVHLDATAMSGDRVRLTITVEGTSTSYVDSGSTQPVPAGPQLVTVSVDGERVQRLPGAGGRCEPGGEVSSYSLVFPADRELEIPLSGPGTHTIEVRAPFCADGELVDDPTSIEVTAEADPPTVTGISADVDGDGSPDTVRLSLPASTSHSETMQVEAELASGRVDPIELPRSEYAELLPARDLDGDGADEIVLSLTDGGDAAWWQVLRESEGRLVEVGTVDETGAKASLVTVCLECGGGPLNRDWVTTLLDDGFYDYRFVDAHPPARAPVELRRWVLSGDTMTRLTATSPGCYVRFEGVTTGAC